MKIKLPEFKYAFLQRNFRNLNFERKIIVIANGVVLFGCLAPWIAIMPVYGEVTNFSAFSGPTKVMGGIIFFISIFILALFAEKMWDKEWFKWIKIEENVLLGFASLQQVILTICVWSVLLSFGQGFENSEIRFGIFICLFAGFASLLATYLDGLNLKKQKVVDFFGQSDKTELGEDLTKS